MGLGNPGAEYADTRHNIGFMTLDALARTSNAVFETARYGDVAHMRVKNAELVLLKPSTFMNLSGNAVRYWRDREKLHDSDILIVVDDCALPFGAIRLRAHGSDAGHNGLKSIAQMLGTEAYPRLKFGIGHDFPHGGQIDYVLGPLTPEQQAELPERLDVAVEAIKTYALCGIDKAMCDFNNK